MFYCMSNSYIKQHYTLLQEERKESILLLHPLAVRTFSSSIPTEEYVVFHGGTFQDEFGYAWCKDFP